MLQSAKKSTQISGSFNKTLKAPAPNRIQIFSKNPNTNSELRCQSANKNNQLFSNKKKLYVTVQRQQVRQSQNNIQYNSTKSETEFHRFEKQIMSMYQSYQQRTKQVLQANSIQLNYLHSVIQSNQKLLIQKDLQISQLSKKIISDKRQNLSQESYQKCRYMTGKIEDLQKKLKSFNQIVEKAHQCQNYLNKKINKMQTLLIKHLSSKIKKCQAKLLQYVDDKQQILDRLLHETTFTAKLAKQNDFKGSQVQLFQHDSSSSLQLSPSKSTTSIKQHALISIHPIKKKDTSLTLASIQAKEHSQNINRRMQFMMKNLNQLHSQAFRVMNHQSKILEFVPSINSILINQKQLQSKVSSLQRFRQELKISKQKRQIYLKFSPKKKIDKQSQKNQSQISRQNQLNRTPVFAEQVQFQRLDFSKNKSESNDKDKSKSKSKRNRNIQGSTGPGVFILQDYQQPQQEIDSCDDDQFFYPIQQKQISRNKQSTVQGSMISVFCKNSLGDFKDFK